MTFTSARLSQVPEHAEHYLLKVTETISLIQFKDYTFLSCWQIGQLNCSFVVVQDLEHYLCRKSDICLFMEGCELEHTNLSDQRTTNEQQFESNLTLRQRA